MNHQVELDAFEAMINALGSFNGTISDSTYSMKKGVELCRDAMGSDEYSTAIMDDLSECLGKYDKVSAEINEVIKYLRLEVERIKNIQYRK